MEDEHGRIYYWNVTTNQVSWIKPLFPVDKEKEEEHEEEEHEEEDIKLKLSKCHSSGNITNRIWSQLSEKQREINELENIFRTNIFSKVLNTSIFLLLTNYLNYWKNVSQMLNIYDVSSKTKFLTRWKETIRYKNTFCNTLELVTKENEMLLRELANTKTKLAQENYSRLFNKL